MAAPFETRSPLLFAISIALVFFALSAQATETAEAVASENSHFVFTGHNVTQTADLFPVGSCTLGTTYGACGVTENLTVGTSPWLLMSYNMANFSVRYQIEKSAIEKTAIQVGYFKTWETGEAAAVDSTLPIEVQENQCRFLSNHPCSVGYRMHALWLYLTKTKRRTTSYRQHFNVQVAYYWDDFKPFSLRRPQAWKTPWQLNVTSLHEAHLVGPYYMQVEVGFLGLEGKFPSLHGGMAGSYRGDDWAFQFGATATGPPMAWLSTERYDAHSQAVFRSQRGLERDFTDEELQNDFSVHPEFFLQYSFQI